MACDTAGVCEADVRLCWLLLFPPNIEQAGSAATLERANSAATLRNLIMTFSLATRRKQAPRLRWRGTRRQSRFRADAFAFRLPQRNRHSGAARRQVGRPAAAVERMGDRDHWHEPPPRLRYQSGHQTTRRQFSRRGTGGGRLGNYSNQHYTREVLGVTSMPTGADRQLKPHAQVAAFRRCLASR